MQKEGKHSHTQPPIVISLQGTVDVQGEEDSLMWVFSRADTMTGLSSHLPFLKGMKFARARILQSCKIDSTAY